MLPSIGELPITRELFNVRIILKRIPKHCVSLLYRQKDYQNLVGDLANPPPLRIHFDRYIIASIYMKIYCRIFFKNVVELKAKNMEQNNVHERSSNNFIMFTKLKI